MPLTIKVSVRAEKGNREGAGTTDETWARVLQVLAEMEEGDPSAEVDNGVSSMMKPSPSTLMLAAGLATAQSTLRDRGSSAGAADLHCAPSTELQAGYPLPPRSS